MSNTPSSESKKPSGFKLFITAVGGLVAISHIGLLGYLIEREPESLSVPTINIPRGPYSSYKIKAGKDGYEIEYRAKSAVLESEDQCHDKNKKGLFGGGSERRNEYRRDQYTMDGKRNIRNV